MYARCTQDVINKCNQDVMKGSRDKMFWSTTVRPTESTTRQNKHGSKFSGREASNRQNRPVKRKACSSHPCRALHFAQDSKGPYVEPNPHKGTLKKRVLHMVHR